MRSSSKRKAEVEELTLKKLQKKKYINFVRVDKLAPHKINGKEVEGCFERETMKELNKEMSLSEYKQLADKRAKKWKTSPGVQPDMDKKFYEADCLREVTYAYNNHGSLFPNNFTKSNINRLNTFLHIQTYGYGQDKTWGRGFSKKELEGITDSMLYFGTSGSSFPWHTEDADLPSINYLHEGKPKIWFVIPACELYLLLIIDKCF